MSPGGELFGRKYPLHIFLGAQRNRTIVIACPHCIISFWPSLACYQDGQVFNVPYVVVIDCAVAPPDVLADHRLQKGAGRRQSVEVADLSTGREVLLPMKQIGMAWEA